MQLTIDLGALAELPTEKREAAIAGLVRGLQPVARKTDPETSHLAAEDAKRNANTLRARCLETLKAHPEGLTDFQLADLVGAQQTSAGKRRGELVAAGLVEKARAQGIEQKRPAPSGSLALVWRYIVR